jgi:hypothetical protein
MHERRKIFFPVAQRRKTDGKNTLDSKDRRERFSALYIRRLSGQEIPSFPAILTNSASDEAAILRMICPR